MNEAIYWAETWRVSCSENDCMFYSKAETKPLLHDTMAYHWLRTGHTDFAMEVSTSTTVIRTTQWKESVPYVPQSNAAQDAATATQDC